MARDVRVMIVDDDPVDLELTRRLLAGSVRMQFKVQVAERLEAAVQMLREGDFQVLLLDLNLPGSSGLNTLDAVRCENDELPIIVLSGLSDEETALRSLDHGAQDYLVKGNVTTETLGNAIRYAIQRQQLLQEITTAKELLERKNRRLAELYETAHRFVDNVSHEFRTPLTVIKEYTSLVRDGLVQTEKEQRHFLDVVADRADDLNTMVDDMLDVSKLEAGLLGAWRKTCDVSQIIDNVRPALTRKALVKGVTLEFEVAAELPAVYCDDEKVSRVIINLTVNAIKFCQEPGQVRIWVRPDPESAGVLIGVTDNGPGIDEESLARIFERFQQLDGNVRGSCKGFGLGLNIAKELVDLNFGQMHVESELGQGSTFSFSLPPDQPLEVFRTYLNRSTHLRDGSSQVSLIATRLDASDAATAEDVDAFLHSLLRRNDLVFRVDTYDWLLVLAAGDIELHKFYEKAHRTLNYINRNRIHGPLPGVEMQTAGTWRAASEGPAMIEQLRQLLESKETVHV